MYYEEFDSAVIGNVSDVKELKDTLGFNEDEIILCSGKTGIGVKELVEAVIDRVPAPTGKKDENLHHIYIPI